MSGSGRETVPGTVHDRLMERTGERTVPHRTRASGGRCFDEPGTDCADGREITTEPKNRPGHGTQAHAVQRVMPSRCPVRSPRRAEWGVAVDG